MEEPSDDLLAMLQFQLLTQDPKGQHSLEAQLLLQAVQGLHAAAGEAGEAGAAMDQALAHLVYVLNEHWLADHNWQLDLPPIPSAA